MTYTSFRDTWGMHDETNWRHVVGASRATLGEGLALGTKLYNVTTPKRWEKVLWTKEEDSKPIPVL